jgi:hypothetical protein
MTELAEPRQERSDRELAELLKLDPHRFARLSASLARQFREADPFPHIAIDGLFDDALLRNIVKEIPPIESELWRVWGSGEPTDFEQPSSLKRGISEEALMGPLTCAFLHSLNSITSLKFLEGLAGITGLVADPSFGGGGLHCTGRGARLLVHVDRDRHPLGNPFNQMINCILYLNEDWDENYGGHIELWSRDGKQRVQRIAPLFNRLVIFQSGSTSYHGHPDPLACPPNRARLSIATYYYIVNRATSADYTGRMKNVQWVNPSAQ